MVRPVARGGHVVVLGTFRADALRRAIAHWATRRRRRRLNIASHYFVPSFRLGSTATTSPHSQTPLPLSSSATGFPQGQVTIWPSVWAGFSIGWNRKGHGSCRVLEGALLLRARALAATKRTTKRSNRKIEQHSTQNNQHHPGVPVPPLQVSSEHYFSVPTACAPS